MRQAPGYPEPADYATRTRPARYRAASMLFLCLFVLQIVCQPWCVVRAQEEVFLCGMEEHRHTSSCYAWVSGPDDAMEDAQASRVLDCTFQPHAHTETCLDADGNLVCGWDTAYFHTHNALCYETGADGSQAMVCPLEEHPVHIHTDSCYALQKVRVCGLEGRPLSAYHIGFVLGPCINASGRLETAMKAMKLLLSGDDHEAASYAQELKDLNEERKELTQQGLEEAMHILEGHGETGDKVYVIFLPSCHESIAGIIAGKVRERSAHPVYILTKSTEKDMIKGSGRSIPAYSMYDGLVPCAGLLEKFGGHRMAAGVTLRAENLPSFRRRLNEECTLTEEDFAEKILIDAAMPLSYISEKLIGEMELLEPFGKGNEKPFFAQKGLRLKSARILGKNRNVLKLRVQGEDGTAMDALYFGDIEKMQAYIADRFGRDELGRLMAGYDNGIRLSVVYYPQMNEYRGNVSPQIVITHYM